MSVVEVDGPCQPCREPLPATRAALTHRFQVAGHEGYIIVGLYPDGRPGELFVEVARQGSTLGGLMDAIAVQVSLGLQHGVPLEAIVQKMAFVRFEPSGPTDNPEIPLASSLVDYVGRWLGRTFLPGFAPAPPPRAVE